MSSYTEYNTQVNYLLGTTSEDFWTAAMRVKAINNAIKRFLNAYDLPEMIKRSTITFDSLGIGKKPSDYFRMVKLWDVDSDGKETNEYIYIPPDEYDKQATSASYYYTEDYDTTDAAIRLKCLPIDAGTLQVRYVKAYTTVVTTASTDSGLSSKWDENVACLAANYLLQNSGEEVESAKANGVMNRYREITPNGISANQYPGGWQHAPRIQSIYEKRSLLN